jgi:hypothetical protein
MIVDSFVVDCLVLLEAGIWLVPGWLGSAGLRTAARVGAETDGKTER